MNNEDIDDWVAKNIHMLEVLSPWDIVSAWEEHRIRTTSINMNGNKLRPYLKSECEKVDAAIFNGDVLWNDAERVELKSYIKRWTRAIDDHERWTRLTESHEGEEAQSTQ